MFQRAGFFSFFLLPILGLVDAEQLLKAAFFSSRIIHTLQTIYSSNMMGLRIYQEHSMPTERSTTQRLKRPTYFFQALFLVKNPFHIPFITSEMEQML